MVKSSECVYEFLQTFPVVCFMSTEDAVKGILTIIWYPGELSAVIIQKTRSKADPAACGDIGKSMTTDYLLQKRNGILHINILDYMTEGKEFS